MLALSKIQDSYSLIKYIVDFEGGMEQDIRDELRNVLKKMEEFMRANIAERKKGPDMFKYTYTAKYKNGEYERPDIAGIYHDSENQVAVATDTRVLIVSKKDYNPEYAGHTVTKKGEILGTEERPIRFPKWRDVIPNTTYYKRADMEEVNEKIRKAQAARKLNKDGIYVIELEGMNKQGNATKVYVPLDNALPLLNMPGALWVGESCRPLYYEDENYQIVIMPRNVTDTVMLNIF